jgi:anaerobic magnesium-protoporphyrin IX monomethyl ester cyclase
MIAHARRRGVRVLVAGSDASDAPQVYLQAGAEVVLLGEGLVALRGVIARLAADLSLDVDVTVAGLQGVATLDANGLRIVRGARTLPESEYASRPAWELIDLERYRRLWREKHGDFSLNMAASRGCPFRCTWCAKPIWGNQYLQRAAREVALEMAQLKSLHQPDHVWFADDIFGFRTDWVQEFAATLAAAGGGVPFTIQTRADLVSAGMASALRAAGCIEAWIGAESGSQRILDAMNKGTTIEEVVVARRRLAAAGIRVGFFIQLGFLGEQFGDLLATRRLVARARPDEIGVSVSYPLPGTRFHEQVREQLGAKTHWRESNDLDMMFRGAYRSEFYRAFRDLLHEQVELQRRDGLPLHAHGYEARKALARRWRRLLAGEAAWRTDSALQAAV